MFPLSLSLRAHAEESRKEGRKAGKPDTSGSKLPPLYISRRWGNTFWVCETSLSLLTSAASVPMASSIAPQPLPSVQGLPKSSVSVPVGSGRCAHLPGLAGPKHEEVYADHCFCFSWCPSRIATMSHGHRLTFPTERWFIWDARPYSRAGRAVVHSPCVWAPRSSRWSDDLRG